MKEMSAKKIVLASIAFLASALLFTGMLFSVIKLDVGFNMEREAGLKIKDVKLFANGYVFFQIQFSIFNFQFSIAYVACISGLSRCGEDVCFNDGIFQDRFQCFFRV